MAHDGPRKGDAIYVPQAEIGTAMSLGATLVEGDARMFIPNILPDGVSLSDFSRWMTAEAKVVWLGELLEGVVGTLPDLMNIAGLMADFSGDRDTDVVPLYVLRSEMDLARGIRGVWWDRNRRMYVADRTADFGLVHRFLTPAMRSMWISERNLDTALSSLVRARAIVGDEKGEDRDELELDPGDTSVHG